MLSRIPQKYYEQLTVRELEDLLERKKRNHKLADLLRDRDRLRLELRRLEDVIDALERRGEQEDDESGGEYDTASSSSSSSSPSAPAIGALGPRSSSGYGGGRGERTYGDGNGDGNGGDEAAEGAPSFLAGKRRKNLKDYIAQILLEANEPLSPSEIQRRLPEAGYVSNSSNPRSFYNTVFQALQRYDIFEKDNKKYRLSDEALKDNGVKEILPKKKTRLKDYIVEVLDKAQVPLKVSEIASRVVIAGYETDLEMDELNQRVSATLKKYLNKDFDWDSQRYKLATRRN